MTIAVEMMTGAVDAIETIHRGGNGFRSRATKPQLQKQ